MMMGRMGKLRPQALVTSRLSGEEGSHPWIADNRLLSTAYCLLPWIANDARLCHSREINIRFEAKRDHGRCLFLLKRVLEPSEVDG